MDPWGKWESTNDWFNREQYDNRLNRDWLRSADNYNEHYPRSVYQLEQRRYRDQVSAGQPPSNPAMGQEYNLENPNEDQVAEPPYFSDPVRIEDWLFRGPRYGGPR